MFIDIYLFYVFGLLDIVPVLQVENIEQHSVVVIISMFVQDILGSGCS